MDVEKLTLELRPRPHWQAVDLGFSLLRSRAGSVYASWWTLWACVLLVACLGAAASPDNATAWLMLPWFARPAAERMVVHVLSRGVFGEAVTWKQALRAWPSTWKGGLVRALTWWRLWALGRSFMQPIWQLEGASGPTASRRREALARRGAGTTAFFWGLACAHIEMGLWLALLAFVGLFTESGGNGNPFPFVGEAMEGTRNIAAAVVGVLSYGLVSGFVGPFYAAGGFTLYLNRRAELEAWDIELALRRIQRRRGKSAPGASAPPDIRNAGGSDGSSTENGGRIPSLRALAILVFASIALAAPGAVAAKATTDTCSPPKWWRDPASGRVPSADAGRAALRGQVDSIYRNEPSLREWKCEEKWFPKDTLSKPEPEEDGFWKELYEAISLIGNFLGRHADDIRWLIVAGAVFLVGWVAWKYRDMFDRAAPSATGAKATPREPARRELPESVLPADAARAAAGAWDEGRRRDALSILYRLACLHALDHGAKLRKGDSESTVRRAARDLASQGRMAPSTAELVSETARIWADAAWADRWPQTESVMTLCDSWSRAATGERRP